MTEPTTPRPDGPGNSPLGNESDPYSPPAGHPPVVGAAFEYAPAPESSPPSRSRGKKILVVVAGVIVAVVVAGLVRWGLASAFEGSSRQDTIDTTVSQLKQQTVFPKQVDQVTAWTDVKAEDGAIHYEYTVSPDVDPSSLTEKKVRDSILPTLCTATSTRRILDDDIAMRYSYTFAGSTKTIETTFTKSDC